jgi:hypothetical protein
MPRNGSGTYSPPAGQPVVAGTTISAATFNSLVTDIGTEITRSVATDGQTPMGANLPMGGNRIVNMARGTQPTDGVRMDQVVELTEYSVDILQYGASTGIADNGPAIQDAIDDLMLTGGVVRVPRGTFKVATAFSLYPNVSLVGVGADLSILDYTTQASGNWLNAHGSLGTSVNIASTMGQAATSCTTASATGAAVDDDFILMSQRNALSSDAGDFQLGLPTGSIHASYFAEVLTVSQIVSSTAFNFVPPLQFPDYRPDATMETDPYARSSATVQKATWIKSVHISGLTFIAGPNSNNAIDFQYAKECSVHDCKFVMGAYTGTAVHFTYSYRCKAYRCIGLHTATAGAVNSNFAFTTYKVVSSWHCGFIECDDINGSQCFDTTYNGDTNPSMYSYVINCRTINARYNSGTNHSGNYAEHFIGNQFIGCQNGLSIRSRASVVKGNILTGTYTGYGIAVSDGWAQDSIVEGNYIENFNEAIDYNDYASGGNGKINSRVSIINNVARKCYYGVYMKHQGWVTAEYNNTVIRGNKFYALDSYMVRVNGYLNGLTISDNEVYGPSTTAGSTSYGVYFDDNSVDHTVENNKFVDMGSTFIGVRMPNISDTTTFPAVTYPHPGIELRNNRSLGTVNPSYAPFAASSILSRVRTWTPAVSTAALWERSGSVQTTLVTDDAGSAGYYFGNSTDQTRAGLAWNNSNGLLTLRVEGAYMVAASTAYFRPYSDNAITLGNDANRWSTIYGYNMTLRPSSSRTPSNNGDLVVEATSDTQVKLKLKGSDGVVRSVTLTLA